MAAATWPSSLPQDLLIQGFDMQMPEGSIRQDMDAGPAYQRNRFTAAPEPFRGELILTKSQYSTFRDFWKNTISYGALKFDWKHPITGNSAEVQFDISSPPTVSAEGNDKFRVTMTIEVQP